MPGPYIFSRQSNNVVSSERGSWRPRFLGAAFAGLDLWPLESAAFSGVSSASDSADDDELSSSSSRSTFGTDSDGVGIDTGVCLLAVFALAVIGFERLGFAVPLVGLFTERIVGGNCIGSPANISFLALKIGIQQI